MNALVLDDEARYREHLKRSLERQGLQIHVAADAAEAQQIVRKLGIDLMIVDIKLANSINGLDFADWAKQRDSNTALIVITGFGSPEYERRSRRLGALAYLEKPFDLKELEVHVQRAMTERRLLREIHRLEQELAGARRGDFFCQTLSEIPVVCVRADGAVTYASSEGQAALDSLVDPARQRPAQTIDSDLLARLHAAAPRDNGWGQVALYRRDGVISHFVAFVRPMNWGDDEGLIALLMDADSSDDRGCDRLWLGLLLKAAQAVRLDSSDG